MPHRIALIVLASLATWSGGRAEAQSGGAGSRAEEEASRPMRLIIEAARIKPKARPADAAPPARPAAATVARPAAPAASPAPAPAAPVAPNDNAAIAAAPTPTAPAMPASEPPPVLASGAPESSVAAAVQAAPRATEKSEAPPDPPETLPAPKLRTLVEPVTPRHLAGRLRGEVRVELQLNVAADGSVSEASVTTSSHPQMNAAVLDAVRQWRYEPAARAREHAVQVVMRPDS